MRDLVSGFSGAGCDLVGVRAGRGRDRLQLFIGVRLGDVGLVLEGLLNEFPDCIVGSSSDAIDVAGGLFSPVVHGQREILKDETYVRLLRQQRIDRRSSLLAVRTLHIAKLDERDGRVGRTLGGAIDTFLELLAGILDTAWRRRAAPRL